MQHCFFQDLATTFDLPGLPDFLTRRFVVDRYERLTGYQPRDLDWFMLYASMRFAIIYLRVAQRQLAFGELEMPDDPDDVLLHRAQLEAMLAGTYW
ncbi:MAG: phosphotransferase family protein, partial [Acidimicrobiales bacterium]